MSNALPLQKLLAAAAATSRPATPQIEVVSTLLTTLCGIGMCVFLVWLAHGVVKPAKFKLSASPGRANHLTPLHVLALLVASILGASLVVKAVGLCVELGPAQSTIIFGMAMPLLGLFGGLIVAARSFDGGAARGMGFTRRRWFNDSVRSVIGFLAILPVCMFLLLATMWVIWQLNPSEELLADHRFLQILKDPDVPMVWRGMVILAAVVFAPFGEEVFFRGLLQSMFRRYLGRPWVAIVVTSTLFSGVHFTDIKSLPAIFALSVALGYNYERTGRLYSPIVIHMLFNLVMIAEALSNIAI